MPAWLLLSHRTHPDSDDLSIIHTPPTTPTLVPPSARAACLPPRPCTAPDDFPLRIRIAVEPLGRPSFPHSPPSPSLKRVPGDEPARS